MIPEMKLTIQKRIAEISKQIIANLKSGNNSVEKAAEWKMLIEERTTLRNLLINSK